MRHLFKNFSKDLFIQPWQGGVRLIDMDKELPHRYFPELKNHFYRVGEILNSPINIFFVDKDSRIIEMNDATINTAGFSCKQSAIGKTVHIAAKKETADHSIEHDRQVVLSKQLKIRESNYMRLDDINLTGISMRFPWFDKNEDIIGVFGFSIVTSKYDQYSLTEALDFVAKTGLLKQKKNAEAVKTLLPGKEFNNVYLSKRELECLYLMVRGKTAKGIADILELSPRTVEQYLNSLKNKFSASSKSELIDKALTYIFNQIMPD